MKSMIIVNEFICPRCNARVEINQKDTKSKCEYCGTEFYTGTNRIQGGKNSLLQSSEKDVGNPFKPFMIAAAAVLSILLLFVCAEMVTDPIPKDVYDESLISNPNMFIQPSEQVVIAALENMEGVTGVKAVTVDNDPNHGLSKERGYISSVYFSLSEIEQTQPSFNGVDVVELGNIAGGNVEVYRNEEDANARIEYLSEANAQKINHSSGFYRVGTTVIRVSHLLSKQRQQEIIWQVVLALDQFDNNRKE